MLGTFVSLLRCMSTLVNWVCCRVWLGSSHYAKMRHLQLHNHDEYTHTHTPTHLIYIILYIYINNHI
jgi:hypothetical protein